MEQMRYPAIVAIAEGTYVRTTKTYASSEEAKSELKDAFICLATDLGTIEKELSRV